MSEEELRTVIREFRASVSAEIEAVHRRLNDLADEVRERIRTVETSFFNALRDLTRLVERRAERSDRRFDGIDGRLDGIDGRLDGIEGQLAVIIDRLPPAA